MDQQLLQLLLARHAAGAPQGAPMASPQAPVPGVGAILAQQAARRLNAQAQPQQGSPIGNAAQAVPQMMPQVDPMKAAYAQGANAAQQSQAQGIPAIAQMAQQAAAQQLAQRAAAAQSQAAQGPTAGKPAPQQGPFAAHPGAMRIPHRPEEY